MPCSAFPGHDMRMSLLRRPGKTQESPEANVLRDSPLKKAATYSPALRCSTIGAPGLNFSVRDGKRWNPGAKAT